MFQAITIPLAISFDPDYFNTPEMKTLNSMIDLVFTFDIILRFRTTYIDSVSGEEVMDSMLIAKKYAKSFTFIIDVLSTVPLDDFSGGENYFLKLLGLLKLIRIFRMNSVILNLNSGQEVKAAFKVGFLVFAMMLYIHLMACIWYLTVSREEKWIPNMDFIWYPEP